MQKSDHPSNGPGDYIVMIARVRGSIMTYIQLEVSADNESDARQKAWDYCRERDSENPRYIHSVGSIRKK